MIIAINVPPNSRMAAGILLAAYCSSFVLDLGGENARPPVEAWDAEHGRNDRRRHGCVGASPSVATTSPDGPRPLRTRVS